MLESSTEIGGVTVAESETVFNPLESRNQEFPENVGIKRPGAPMETHEATFADNM